jgi:outer membrane cobalamin receptor
MMVLIISITKIGKYVKAQNIFFVFVLVLGIQLKLNAQAVLEGIVFDFDTKLPLTGVSVICKNQPGNGVVTDTAGFFRIESDTGNQFSFRFIGYETYTYTCYKSKPDKCADTIYLKTSSTMLSEFVVSASKSSQQMKDLTVSMESVKPYLAENKNITNPDKLVEQIPGVNVIDGQVNIRNGSGWSYGTGSRVMLMVDGMPMMSGDAGQVLWSFLPVENLDNTEVIKGASSVLFGSSALNGVIHIQTATPSSKPVAGVTTYYGIYSKPPSENLIWSEKNQLSQYGTLAFFSQKIKSTEFTFNANYIQDDGYRMGEQDYRKKAGFNVNHHFNKKLSAGIRGNIMQSESGAFLLWQDLDSGYTAYNRQLTTTQSLRYHVDPYLTYKHKNTTHHLRMRYLYIDNNVDNGNPENDQSNSSDFVWGEYQVAQRFPKFGLLLNAGTVFSYTQSVSPLFEGNQTAENAAVYLQADKAWKKFNLSAGARWEHYKLNDYQESKPVFRTGVNYQLLKYTFLRSSWGQGYRFPTIAESFISTSVGILNVYPNPDLRSETGWNLEFGVKQGWKINKVNGYFDLAFFRMEYDNMMEFIFGQWNPPSPNDPFGIGFKSVNVGKSRIDGIELSVSGEGKIGNNGKLIFLGGFLKTNPISIDTGYVFGTSFYGDSFNYVNTSSNPESQILKYRSRTQARFDIQYEYKKFDIGISYRYNSYIENIDNVFVNPFISLFIKDIAKGRETAVNGMHYFDMRMGFKPTKNFKISLIANNLMNKIYMLRPADLQAPRSVIVQLRYML